jgi:hypothetical protein
VSLPVAVPFHLSRSDDVISGMGVTTTTEVIHGLLRLDAGRLVIQWRLSRSTEHVGSMSAHVDRELEAVQEVTLPLSAVAGAVVRRPRWAFWAGPTLVLRAADLRAFEEVTGEAGLKLAHPAEIVLRLRRADLLAGEEFSAELALALAERALGESRRSGALERGDVETEGSEP